MPGENDRFARWQKITIDHFGYSSNLILTLALATLAYALSFAKDSDFVAHKAHRSYLGFLLLAGLFFLVISIILGLLCTWNRLRDFRGTAQRARNAHDAPSKDELDEMGKRTWRLFYGQVVTFGVAMVCLVIVIGAVRLLGLFSN